MECTARNLSILCTFNINHRVSMNSPISSTWNHVSFLKTNKFTINAWGRLFRECLFEGSFKCLLYFVQIFLIFFIHSSISNSKSFLIATFYRPPINSTYLPSNFDNIFNDQLSNASCEKKEMIVLGDFNTDLLKKDNKTCLLYTSPSPRDATLSRMPSSA